jgi:hypothetical protein
MSKREWRIVPVAATPEMAYATKQLYIEAEEIGITAPKSSAIYHTMVDAAPSPWIPLNPRHPNHRMPTKDDADITGRILTWSGYCIAEDWIRVTPDINKFWMPMPPGPNAYAVGCSA